MPPPPVNLEQALVPVPPDPVVAQDAAPPNVLAPVRNADANRHWSRDSAPMTPELQADTRPYLDVVMRLGADFKIAHAISNDPKKQQAMEDKLLARYVADNPLHKQATFPERAIYEHGAHLLLQNFRDELPARQQVRAATRTLRNDFKHHTSASFVGEVRQQFEQRYDQLRRDANRMQPSLLEQALPADSPLRTKLDPLTGGLRDPATGLYANLVRMGEGQEQKHVLVFGGTKTADALGGQLQADVGQFLGGVPKAYKQAAELTAQVNTTLQAQGLRLETAGHSLGGGLAHYAALKNGGIQATCFNAAALGGGCKASIGANLAQAKTNVRHINVDGDAVGDGIGMLRVPVQTAADGVQFLRRTAQDGVNDATQPLRQVAGEAKDTVVRFAGEVKQSTVELAGEVKDTGTRIAENVKDTVAEIGDNVKDTLVKIGGEIKETAVEIGGEVKQTVSQSPIGQGVQHAVQIAAQSPPGRMVGQTVHSTTAHVKDAAGIVKDTAGHVKETVEKVGGDFGVAVTNTTTTVTTSVRDVLRRAKGGVHRGISELKENAGNLVHNAGETLKQTSAGQKAVEVHENLGFGRGRLAIPHQYGACTKVNNGGELNPKKNNPLANHSVKALAKAYDRNQQQNQAVRNQVALGGPPGGGPGHGHGV